MVGLLIIATNNYIKFLKPLIESADKHFLNNKEVTYFIFSNVDFRIKSHRNIVNVKIEHQDWPFMTLNRYLIFNEHKSLLTDMEYLYYCDADMLFVDNVGDEILSDLVGTLHFGYVGKRGTPETNKLSTAYIGSEEEMTYFAGGFNGGKVNNYLEMCEKLMNNIKRDLSNNIIAIWHDESHLNRYFIDNKPTLILDPGYCYHQGSNKPYSQKLLALSKDHKIRL